FFEGNFTEYEEYKKRTLGAKKLKTAATREYTQTTGNFEGKGFRQQRNIFRGWLKPCSVRICLKFRAYWAKW
ncbi:hypothetical protein O5560_26580, partial [Escherichia coli]|nr:hypothetical protein [Escherichia coli]